MSSVGAFISLLTVILSKVEWGGQDPRVSISRVTIKVLTNDHFFAEKLFNVEGLIPALEPCIKTDSALANSSTVDFHDGIRVGKRACTVHQRNFGNHFRQEE